MFFSESKDSGYMAAAGLIIGFALLVIIEFIIHWYKAKLYEGYTFKFSSEGIEKRIGSTVKMNKWKDYQCFTTSFSAKHGKIFSWMPFSSLVFSETDRYTINLYDNENMAISDAYNQIRTLPENHEQVVSFISQYLPQKRQRLRYNTTTNIVLVILSIICVAIIAIAVSIAMRS